MEDWSQRKRKRYLKKGKQPIKESNQTRKRGKGGTKELQDRVGMITSNGYRVGQRE